MTEIYLDGLLDELVRVEPRERWDDVLERARRAQRRYTVLVVAIAVLVLAPATWAAVKAFEGTPAPPAVQRYFTLTNGTRLRAHGVIQVQTPYGPLGLWVAPQYSSGRCWWVVWQRTMSDDGGTCSNPGAPAPPIDVGTGTDDFHPSVTVLNGSVAGSATSLDVKLTDGRSTTLPVVEHLVLGVVPQRGPRVPGISYAVARDASGKVVACEGLFESLQQKEKTCS